MRFMQRPSVPRPPQNSRKSEQSTYSKASRILEQTTPSNIRQAIRDIRPHRPSSSSSNSRPPAVDAAPGSTSKKDVSPGHQARAPTHAYNTADTANYNPHQVRQQNLHQQQHPQAEQARRAQATQISAQTSETSSSRRRVTSLLPIRLPSRTATTTAADVTNTSVVRAGAGEQNVAVVQQDTRTGKTSTTSSRPTSSRATTRASPERKPSPSHTPKAEPGSRSGSGSSKSKTSKQRSGRSVGHYIIGETLGEGTFGKVRRGMHTLTGETVAVKVLEKSKIKTEGDLTRVTREIKILKKTRHGNCMRLLEVIDTPKQIFLMMEFLDGGELFDYIVEKHRLTEQEACEIFSQIIDGVQYLHDNHIIHRDLKPENLLMQRHSDGSFLIKVADYGLSNLVETSSLLSTACGSPCYAAPEMIAGKKYDGTKSDTWSLGVVLFALVAGYLPFEDNDTPKLYRKILNAEYKCPSSLSTEAKDLLSQILEVNPSKRVTIDGIRKHVWMRRHLGISRMRDNQSFRSFMSLQSLEEEQDPSTGGTIEIDERILHELGNYGLDREYICKSILAKKHNSATASYFLITERFRRLEQRGVALKPRRMYTFPQPQPVESEEVADAIKAAQDRAAANSEESEQKDAEDEENVTQMSSIEHATLHRDKVGQLPLQVELATRIDSARPSLPSPKLPQRRATLAVPASAHVKNAEAPSVTAIAEASEEETSSQAVSQRRASTGSQHEGRISQLLTTSARGGLDDAGTTLPAVSAPTTEENLKNQKSEQHEQAELVGAITSINTSTRRGAIVYANNDRPNMNAAILSLAAREVASPESSNSSHSKEDGAARDTSPTSAKSITPIRESKLNALLQKTHLRPAPPQKNSSVNSTSASKHVQRPTARLAPFNPL